MSPKIIIVSSCRPFSGCRLVCKADCGFQAAIARLLPAQAFRRLPRAGASPCTPPNLHPFLHRFRLPYRVRPKGSLRSEAELRS
ncbi:hypothetical protein [Kingella oralis]|uniref:hypothetical protein n=1 Tax=Kingella oralis TaxID=505 RepID=UPI00145F4B28